MDLIKASHVTFGYDATPVLLDVDLSIKAGDFLAIIGPNGSGKTTLVKILLGLLRPSSGRVEIMGRPVEEFTEWRTIGYVPQKATHIDPFFPASVEEVVGMALLSNKRILGRPSARQPDAVLRALRQVDLEEYRSWRIGRLSGGQQQRVFIARALVTGPRVLFLDEPTTGVDAATQGRFYDILDGLNKAEGITIVLITHDIGIVNRHVTQVACLNQRLAYHGSHEEFCRSGAFRDMIAHGDHLVSHEH
ncbi:MAG: metal ABC transporter ATP-binding protein [Acidobacteriota bacterium]